MTYLKGYHNYYTTIQTLIPPMKTHQFFKYFLLIGLFFLSSQAHALEIKNIRFGEHPDKLRTVLELNKKTDFKAFTLPPNGDNSYRIVIDLPKFKWNAGDVKIPRKSSVKDVRTGEASSQIMRIVIDMSAPTILQDAFLLPAAGKNPVRLVIDSKNISKAAFNDTKRVSIGTLESKGSALNTIVGAQSVETKPVIAGVENLKQKAGITPGRKPTQSASENPTISPLRKPLIVIDAGHGGADPGAIGSNKLREKDITLSAAKVLKKKLEATGRYRAALTRSSDKYIKLYRRVSIARDKEADLFISLHADSIGQSNVRGASIYTLSNTASDKQTAKLAARENQADLIAGVDLSHEDKDVANILIDLAMRDTMNQSKFFANTVVKNMDKKGVRTLTRPHRYAGFAVLKAPDIPSVLVEMGFMTNSKEARLLATGNYQEKIADSLIYSLDTYFSKVRKNAL